MSEKYKVIDSTVPTFITITIIQLRPKLSFTKEIMSIVATEIMKKTIRFFAM